MALLNPLKKGLVLYGDDSREPASEANLIEYGRAYEDEGRPSDALDFYGRAGYTERIETIVRRALDGGDYFLFQKACALIGREPEPGDLTTLGENALKSGRLVFARQAFEAAGDKKGLKRAENEMEKSGFIQNETPETS
jgi:hypothetical protein